MSLKLDKTSFEKMLVQIESTNSKGESLVIATSKTIDNLAINRNVENENQFIQRLSDDDLELLCNNFVFNNEELHDLFKDELYYRQNA